MNKFLSQVAFGGDCVNYPIDKKDSISAMIILIGGYDNSDVELIESDSENGTFTTYAKIARSKKDLFASVQLSIDGAKKFLKVINVKKAYIIFGDTKYNPSDFDLKGNADRLYAYSYEEGENESHIYFTKKIETVGTYEMLSVDVDHEGHSFISTEKEITSVEEMVISDGETDFVRDETADIYL